MTYERREEIFAKEYLTEPEIAELLGISDREAYGLMKAIRKESDTLGIRGKIHVADYMRFFRIPLDGRYGRENAAVFMDTAERRVQWLAEAKREGATA